VSRITKQCRHCNAAFTIPQCRDWREHYCSIKCRHAFRAEKNSELDRTCPVCGSQFKSRRNIDLKSCSPQCAGVMRIGRKQSEEWISNRLQSWLKNGNREKQAARSGPAHPMFAGMRIVAGYIWLWTDGRGYVQEHRLVAELMLGRPLTNDEVVHHKNEIRSDNRPSNLAVMTRAEHMQEHSAEIRAAAKVAFKPRAQKLKAENIHEIRSLAASGMKHVEIARRYGVTATNIGLVVKRQIWAHV
jgi:hypothetical protein